jgi:tetratricopeptide (TPR) repeat protein
MKREIELKLEQANKLIFVKDYEAAKDLLIEVVSSDQGKEQLIVHLRLAELAVKLNAVEEFLLFYDEMRSEQIFSEKTTDFSKAFIKQHAELVSMEESVELFIKLVDKYKDEPAGYYAIGFGLEYMHNWERAIANYEKALSIDSSWYPSYFGLSQIYYNLNSDDKGDHFFYLYEKEAPYNLYGNFDTHRKLCNEFLEKEEFEYALNAIDSLSEWWEENKGICPKEIKIFEQFTKARITGFSGDRLKSDMFRKNAMTLVTEVLRSHSFDTGALYFIAKVLEEHTEFDMALNVYKLLLKRGDVDPAIVQKIGSQFLTLGQNDIAYDLFDEAYKENPGNRELAFGKLVSKLRSLGIDVESYLAQREKMQSFVNANGDKVELFSLLHSLLAQFEGDAQVHYEIAVLYLDMGNSDRAISHIDLMYALEEFNPNTSMKAANFYLKCGKVDQAFNVLNQIKHAHIFNSTQLEEYQHLQATVFMQLGQFETATNFLQKLIEVDPWNVSYLVQLIYSKSMKICEDKGEYEDETVKSLMSGYDHNLDWAKFDKISYDLQGLHETELYFLRTKLRYLYAQGSEEKLLDFVHAAITWNPMLGGNELIRLLNTNFDSPQVYYGLSVMFSEQWQLEVSSMWAEQALLHPEINDEMRRRLYLKLADNYLWQGSNLEKALQYATFAHELGVVSDEEANRVIGHAYLKQGKPKEAGAHLDQGDSLNLETSYLKGLLEFRNGALEKANKIWKPLLTVKSVTLKDHHIKQELLKYYFESEPYLKVN